MEVAPSPESSAQNQEQRVAVHNAIRQVLPPETENPQEIAAYIERTFGKRWEEALSLMGRHLLDRNRRPFINQSLAEGMSLAVLASRLHDGTPYAELMDEIFERTLPDGRKRRPPSAAYREELALGRVMLPRIKDSREFIEEHIVVFPFDQADHPLSAAPLQARGIRDEHKLEVEVWLTDPALVKAVRPYLEHDPHHPFQECCSGLVEDEILLGTLDMTYWLWLGNQVGIVARIHELYDVLRDTRGLPEALRQQVGHVQTFLERLARVDALERGVRDILAPSGAHLMAGGADVPVAPNAAERLTATLRRAGYRVVYVPTEGVRDWLWQNELTPQPSDEDMKRVVVSALTLRAALDVASARPEGRTAVVAAVTERYAVPVQPTDDPLIPALFAPIRAPVPSDELGARLRPRRAPRGAGSPKEVPEAVGDGRAFRLAAGNN